MTDTYYVSVIVFLATYSDENEQVILQNLRFNKHNSCLQ